MGKTLKSVEKETFYWQLTIIAIVAVICYFNTFAAPFVFDDIRVIVDNPAIRNLGDLLTSRTTMNTRLIGFLSFALNYKLHGLSVFGYHCFNLIIHITNGILVFLITRLFCTFSSFGKKNVLHNKLTPTFAALLFISHPVQTQAVTYIVQRFASLATCFSLIAILLYISSQLCITKRRGYLFRFLSLVATVLALLTKEFTIVLPAILMAWDFLFGKGSNRQKGQRLLPFFCAIAIVPIMLFRQTLSSLFSLNLSEIEQVISTSAGIHEPTFTAMNYFFTQCRVFLTYLRLLFWPTNQNLDYDFPVYRTFWTWEVYIPFILVLVAIFASFWLTQRARRFSPENQRCSLISVFLLWAFLISFLTESSVIPIADVIFEHRLYFPSVWFFIFSALMIQHAIDKLLSATNSRKIAGVTLCILLTACGSTATWLRNQTWQSEESLWRDTVSKSPGKFRPRQNLSVLLKKQGRYGEALEIIQLAKPSTKNNSYINHALLSDIYLGLGNIQMAINENLLALEVKPENVERLSSLGAMHAKNGNYSEAISALKRALAIDPDRAETSYNLGHLYNQLGQYALAENFYKEALLLNENYKEAAYNLGTLYNQRGDYLSAEKYLIAAIKIDQGFLPAYNNLVISLEKQGRTIEAKEWCQKALEINPDDPTANNNWNIISK